MKASVAREDGRITVRVEDDGRGLAKGANPRLGMLGMQERVSAAGGVLTIRSGERNGLRIEARLPLVEDAA